MEIGFSERLLEERTRLGLTQEQFGHFGGVQKIAQYRYETGERTPDAAYVAGLSSIGVDVLYLLTGQRTPTAQKALSKDEQKLIEAYRKATDAHKAVVRQVAVMSEKADAPKVAKPTKQKAGRNAVQVVGDVTGGIQAGSTHGDRQQQPKNKAKRG